MKQYLNSNDNYCDSWYRSPTSKPLDNRKVYYKAIKKNK